MRAVPLLAALLVSATHAAGDPFAARVRYDDVDRFFRMYDASGGKPIAERLRRDYIEAGSPGVRDFVPYRIESAEALAAKVAEDRAMYERARRCRVALPGVERRMRAAYLAFQTALPEAELPDTTILIGQGNSGGAARPAGVLIGLEVVCDPAPGGAPLDVRLTHLIAHELGHTQQAGFRGDTLLDAALTEGVADFVGELISGAPLNAEMFGKAERRAQEIERAFAAEMTVAARIPGESAGSTTGGVRRSGPATSPTGSALRSRRATMTGHQTSGPPSVPCSRPRTLRRS